MVDTEDRRKKGTEDIKKDRECNRRNGGQKKRRKDILERNGKY
jgi:hypothetical protein